jgi:hypothetical protein
MQMDRSTGLHDFDIGVIHDTCNNPGLASNGNQSRDSARVMCIGVRSH